MADAFHSGKLMNADMKEAAKWGRTDIDTLDGGLREVVGEEVLLADVLADIEYWPGFD
jgi:hypothetical protein